MKPIDVVAFAPGPAPVETRNIGVEEGHVDVLILTALEDELAAVLALGDDWSERKDRGGFPYHLRQFTRDGGKRPLVVAAAWLGKMGRTVTAIRGSAFLGELDPDCVAMCGICAGMRGETELGDVIIADKLFSFDEGKLVAAPGKEPELHHEIKTHDLHPLWTMNAASVKREMDLPALQKLRPPSKEAQSRWLRHAQYAHEVDGGPAPDAHADQETACPDWTEILDDTLSKGLLVLKAGTLSLTDAGREEALNERRRFRKKLPRDPDLRVHVGTVGTGSAVQKDPRLFPRLRRVMRSTIGVEMEGAAIGELASHFEKRGIVVKAVSDHGDLQKDDSFRAFACRASAEVLLAFLLKHVEPAPRPEPPRDPAKAPLPANAPPAPVKAPTPAEAPLEDEGGEPGNDRSRDRRRLLDDRRDGFPAPVEPSNTKRIRVEMVTIVFFATGWGSAHGGINVVNMELATALAAVLRPAGRVLCVVPRADHKGMEEAKTAGVTLVSLGLERDNLPDFFDPGWLGDAEKALKTQGVWPIDWCIGHDAISGHAANLLKQNGGARGSAVISHMSYADYQGVKHASFADAKKKSEEQRKILKGADVVLAVGPLLRDRASDMVDHEVTMIVPGLSVIAARPARKQLIVLSFGRFEAKNDRIKQIRLVAEGLAEARRRASEPGGPTMLNDNPHLKLIGVSKDEKEALELGKIMQKRGGKITNLHPLPYQEDRQKLFEEIAGSNLALMMSWHEGFGLTGWESIAAEVPLIISKQSGLYRFLNENGLHTLVHGGTVDGSFGDDETPNFSETDLKWVADKILEIANDLAGAQRVAKNLKNQLRTGGWTWERAAREVLVALRITPPASSDPSGSGPVQPAQPVPVLLRIGHQVARFENPFHPAGTLPVGHPTYVFRTCDAALTAALKSKPLVAIEGDFSTGKSSLAFRARAELAVTHNVCYVDLQGRRTDDEGIFMREFFIALSKTLNRKVDDWPLLLDDNARRPLALIIDELGALRLSRHVAQSFIPRLVQFATSHKDRVRVIVCVPVFTPQDSIQGFLESLGVENPRNARDWCSIRVPLLDSVGIDHLIAFLPQRALLVARQYVDVLVKRSGGHPEFVQRVCEKLSDAEMADASSADLLGILSAEGSYK